MLNMAKACILVGPKSGQLSQERWHGAAYGGHRKASRNLLTEEVTVREKGVVPLFYETVTGATLRHDVTLRMRDVFPFLVQISADLHAAAATRKPFVIASWSTKVDKAGAVRGTIMLHEYGESGTLTKGLTKRKVLLMGPGWKRVSTKPLTYATIETKVAGQDTRVTLESC